MPLREQTKTSLILTIAALALSILAGAVIAINGGGRGSAETLSWTPPAPTAVAAMSEPTATPTPAPTATATAAPTATPTRIPPTPVRAPSATPTASSAASADTAPVARILQGPANLRSGPGRDFGVARVANEGETFAATGQTADGAWLRLCCVNDAPVWVAGELAGLPAGANLPVVK